MAISKENNLFLLSGQRATSWLAAQSCRIGLDAPQLYHQTGDAVLFKFNETLVAVWGGKQVAELTRLWQAQLPSETVYHSLDGERKKTVLTICKNLAGGAVPRP